MKKLEFFSKETNQKTKSYQEQLEKLAEEKDVLETTQGKEKDIVDIENKMEDLVAKILTVIERQEITRLK